MAGRDQEKMLKVMSTHFKQHGGTQDAVDEPTRYACDMCGLPGYGPRLSCRSCRMTYHPSCEACPGRLPCFLHPGQHDMTADILSAGSLDCFLCDEKIVGLYYKCDPTHRNVHPTCFLLRQDGPAEGRPPQEIGTHFTHPAHPLRELYRWSDYRCDGCGTRGFGLRFRCEACDFDLHPFCAQCPPRVPCFLHPGAHEMVQMVVKSGRSECCPCGHPIASTEGFLGLHYECETSRLDAHPLCFLLQQLPLELGKSNEQPPSVAVQKGVAGERGIRKRDVALQIAKDVGVPFLKGFVRGYLGSFHGGNN